MMLRIFKVWSFSVLIRSQMSLGVQTLLSHASLVLVTSSSSSSLSSSYISSSSSSSSSSNSDSWWWHEDSPDREACKWKLMRKYIHKMRLVLRRIWMPRLVIHSIWVCPGKYVCSQWRLFVLDVLNFILETLCLYLNSSFSAMTPAWRQSGWQITVEIF